MSKFDAYLRDAGLTNAAFAASVGVSEATISRLRNGKQVPSWVLIQRIRDVTNGTVMPNDFLSVEQIAS